MKNRDICSTKDQHQPQLVCKADENVQAARVKRYRERLFWERLYDLRRLLEVVPDANGFVESCRGGVVGLSCLSFFLSFFLSFLQTVSRSSSSPPNPPQVTTNGLRKQVSSPVIADEPISVERAPPPAPPPVSASFGLWKLRESGSKTMSFALVISMSRLTRWRT